MKNWDHEGSRLVYTAPAGGVTAGVLLVIEGTVVAPLKTAAAGAQFVGILTGVITDVAKSPDFAAATGANAYWDSTDGLLYGTDTATNRRVGVFAEAAAEAATTCAVRLDGVSLGAGGDLENKADKAIPSAAHNLAKLTAGGNLEDGGPLPVATVPIYATVTAVKALTTQDEEFEAGTLIAVEVFDELPWSLQWCPTFDCSEFVEQDSYEPRIVVPDDVWALETPVGAWANPESLYGVEPEDIDTEGGSEDDVLTLVVSPYGGDPYPAWMPPTGGGGATNLLLTTRKTFTVQHDAGPLSNPLTITLGIAGCTSTETADGFAQDISNQDWIGITEATASFQIYMNETNNTWHYDAETLLGHPTVYVQTGSGRSIPVSYLAGASTSCVEVHAVIAGMGGIFALKATFDDATQHNVLTSDKHAHGYLTA